MDNERFYYFEKLEFYFNSLNQFGMFDPTKLDKKENIEIIKELLKKEKNSEYAKQMAFIHIPLFFVCMAYQQYPNAEDRIFSFEDILYDPIVIDYLGYIYNQYKDKRARSPKEWSHDNPCFLYIDFNNLKKDIPKIEWNQMLKTHIISSQYNSMSFPLLIEYKGKILIAPTRLKIAREMIYERLLHNFIHSHLSIVSENDFQKKILDILEKNNCMVRDPLTNKYWIYISDKKKATFEFDILAVFNNYILVIECKAFHPTAFYHLLPTVEGRRKKVQYYSEQFKKKIHPWFCENLKKSRLGHINIVCRSRDIGATKTKQFTLNLEDRIKYIDHKQIIGLFITQHKEYFKGYSNIFQIHYKDIEDFLDHLK
ncbi:MAG: hypothetical protein JW891_04740 [Candidatus Lokiarchaeota archaeon]|nr:hypothetical protein [Candidatus Lokiarchaeota archaeon]